MDLFMGRLKGVNPCKTPGNGLLASPLFRSEGSLRCSGSTVRWDTCSKGELASHDLTSLGLLVSQ